MSSACDFLMKSAIDSINSPDLNFSLPFTALPPPHTNYNCVQNCTSPLPNPANILEVLLHLRGVSAPDLSLSLDSAYNSMFRSHSFQHPAPSSSPYQQHIERQHQRSSSAGHNRGWGSSNKRWKCPLSPGQIKVFDDKIRDYFRNNAQCNELFKKKMRLRDALYAVMKGVFPHCGLYVVGSSMNGFGHDTSDMDLCLMISHYEIDQKNEAGEILSLVRTALRNCSFLTDIYIIKAKVPILRFKDRSSGIECDLNVNNLCGILNTHLLHAYSQLDPRIRPLVLYIKYWAKVREINDAARCTLSSYSLVLMVIHFLQCGVFPSVLPCLHRIYPQRFSSNTDIRQLALNVALPDFQSVNTQTVGELFVAFLNYFAHLFNFERDAISVREGQCLPRELVTRQNPIVNPPSQWKEICIEEPFNLSNTARSVYDHTIFEKIVFTFQSSYGQLVQSGELESILE